MSGFARRQIFSYVRVLAHADDLRANGRMRQDESQRHFRQSHPGGDQRLQFSTCSTVFANFPD